MKNTKRILSLISANFSKMALVVLLFYGCYPKSKNNLHKQNVRPNIVWIMAENIGPDLGCYGTPAVKTPNLDNMAKEGILYNKAFTTAPVCSPSRAAMMTGAYQISTNTQNLRMNTNRRLPEPYKAITYYLRKAGYYTALGCGYSNKTDINFSPKEGTLSGFDGDDWKYRKPGQPFFAQITLPITHRGNNWYSNSPDVVKYKEMDNPKTPFYYLPAFADSVNPKDVVLPPTIPDHPVIRDDWARYLTQIEKMDVQVGQILQRIKDEGIEDNTIVIFISDNGADIYREEYWLYDGGIHVPMIVRWPGKLKASEVNDDLISTIDISATILEIADVKVPDYMDGVPFIGLNTKKRDYIYAARDRIDGSIDRIRCVRSERYKYIRNFMPEKGYRETKWVMINNPTLNVIQKLYEEGKLTPIQALHMAKTKAPEELYDLSVDPYEFNNLVDAPEYQKTLEKMRVLLNNWIEETGDTGQYPEKREDAKETTWFNFDDAYGNVE